MQRSAPVHRTIDAEDVELGDVNFWALPESEREGAFLNLREHLPVSFHAEQDFPGLPVGPGFWAITRYEDVRMVSRDAATYISSKGTNIPDFPPFLLNFFGSMINMDDPRHNAMRRLVSSAFTPRRVEAFNRAVDAKAKQVVDRLCDLGGACDFVEQVAAPLPLEIICELMGVEPRHVPRVLELTNVVLSGGDPELAAGIDVILRAAAELSEIGREAAKDRMKKPRDDVVSSLVNGDVDGQRLSPGEFASFFILLTAAGNETTRTAISHGMKAFSDFPEQRALLMSDLERYLPSAVEEIVRWSSPVISFRRTTTRAVVISGQPIKAGEKVVMFYNSANRDARAFSEPFAFDITRTPNEHLGFGGGGTHFCLGAGLARREISALFRELLTRVPDLHITGAPAILQSGFVHGVKRMRCEYSASRA
jgi:cytochrome P450